MRNDTALSCYLLLSPPTQEEEVVDFCGEESPEEQVPILWPLQQGRDGDRI